jgi:hypothetical protein
MAIADDLSVTTAGDIRWEGTTATYTVLEFHRFLQDLADDAVASGDDLIDITSSTPSERSTDNIISLLGTYNVDDEVVEHLYNGSISQNSGDDVYSGLVVVGSVESGTELQIIQDNKVLAPFWGATPALNADAPNNVITRILVKTRSGGADIDRQALRVQARELGDTYAEFSLTAGLGNSTAAVFTSADLNNTTIAATIEAWSTIGNTEGFQLVDIEQGGGPEEYYAQWDTGSQSINDVYEYTKWVQKRGLTIDTDTQTGTDLVIDNATITGQAQLLTNTATAQKLVRVEFDLKKVLAPTGSVVAALYASDGGSPEAPTGGALATSNPIEVTRIKTAGYNTFTFTFDDNVTLSASTNYFIGLEMAAGATTDGTNYIVVDGDSTAGSGMAVNTAGWVGDSTAGTTYGVFASPIMHEIAAELFRGITHEIVWNTGSGTFQEDEVLVWGTDITYNTLSGTFTEGEYVTIGASGAAGKVLYDNGTTNMIVSLEDTSITLITADAITGLTSGATANINVTILNNADSGGEGILLALDDNTGSGDFYIQLTSGSAPVDTLPIRGLTSAATAAVNTTVNTRTISPEFIGASTGSNIIGAYGIAFDPNDVTASDQFFDLTNTLRQPPNNVTFTVTGLVDSEDRVLVAPRTGSVIDYAQRTLSTTLSAADESSVVVTVAIPSDTPSSGTIRVQLDSGIYKRVRYSSWTGSTFTIIPDDAFADGDVTVGTDSVNLATHSYENGDHVQLTSTGTLPAGLALATDYYVIVVDANNIKFAASLTDVITPTPVIITAAAGGGTHTVEAMSRKFDVDNATAGTPNVFISYIDNLSGMEVAEQLSYTAIYSTDRILFVRVRDGGATPIKTFESPATFGNANASIAAIRTSDS